MFQSLSSIGLITLTMHLLVCLKEQDRQLQLIQNAAAQVFTKIRKVDHITPVLKSVHWFPVHQRIDFEILLLV